MLICNMINGLNSCDPAHCFRQETSPMLSVCLRSYCIMVSSFHLTCLWCINNPSKTAWLAFLKQSLYCNYETFPIMYDFCVVYTFFISDPLNGRVLQNVEKYEKLLVTSSATSLKGDGLRRPTSSNLRTREAYETLCQTRGSQVFITVNHCEHILCVRKYLVGIRDN